MKKEFVVKSIDAAPDGAPYVVVSLSSIKDLKEGAGSPQSPFGGPKVMGFTNMNDMMKDLNKMLSGAGGFGMQSGITQLKLEMHEYRKESHLLLQIPLLFHPLHRMSYLW